MKLPLILEGVAEDMIKPLEQLFQKNAMNEFISELDKQI